MLSVFCLYWIAGKQRATARDRPYRFKEQNKSSVLQSPKTVSLTNSLTQLPRVTPRPRRINAVRDRLLHALEGFDHVDLFQAVVDDAVDEEDKEEGQRRRKDKRA